MNEANRKALDKAIGTIMGDALSNVTSLLLEIEDEPDIVDAIDELEDYLKELKSYLVKK